MLARIAHVAIFVIMAIPAVRAQALCPKADAQQFDLESLHSRSTTTVESDLAAFSDSSSAATWRMASTGGIGSDGVAIDGVVLKRNARSDQGKTTVNVVVDLRASDSIVVDLELALVDGVRTLRLGTFDDIPVHCQAIRIEREFKISGDEFQSYQSMGRAPVLRVRRTVRGDGC